MYCDLPILKRCCFCLPLRPGLIAWGYIKTVVVLVLTALLLIIMGDNIARLNHSHYYSDPTNIIIQTLLVLLMLLDVAFSVTFLVSAHKKNHDLMKKCLHYHIFIFVVSNIILFLFIGYLILMTYFFLGEFIITFAVSVGLLNAVLQFYVILLIRSEIHKLSNECYFQFQNNAASAQCQMTIGKLTNGILGAPQTQDKLELVNEEVPPGRI